MANNLIAQTRQAAQNQMAPQDFFSMGNLKKFGSDLLGGAVPGAIGGTAVGIGQAGYNALAARMAPTAAAQTLPGGAQLINRSAIQGSPGQMTNGALRLNNTGQLAGALRGTPALTGNAPLMGRNIQNMLPNAAQATQAAPGFLQQAGQSVGSFGALAELISKMTPSQPQQSGISPALQQGGPRASSGPIGGGGASDQQRPYYSFEQFLRGGNDLRPLMPDKEIAYGVTGQAPEQPVVAGQNPRETIGTQEDPYRPKSGISQKLYDFTKYVEESPVIQGVSGAIAGGAATFFSGGTATPFLPAIGAAGGGLTKGIAGQLRQWLSVKQAQEQAQAQQSAVAQPLMQGSYNG